MINNIRSFSPVLIHQNKSDNFVQNFSEKLSSDSFTRNSSHSHVQNNQNPFKLFIKKINFTGETDLKVISGKLSRGIEGGWIIKGNSGGVYQLMHVDKFLKEDWFKQGTQVNVKGKEEPRLITIFMQGIPFNVKSIEPKKDK